MRQGLLKFILQVTISLFFTGCYDFANEENTENPAVDSRLLEHLNSTARILGAIISDTEVRSELIQGVALDYQGDSQILFSHLLDDSDGAFYARKGGSKFKSAFLKQLGIDAANGRVKENSEFINFLAENNVGVYAPYFSLHNWQNEITIASHPLTNEESNFGLKYVFRSDSQPLVYKVFVDDEYAARNPTLIILPVEDCKDCISACPAETCIHDSKSNVQNGNFQSAGADCRDYTADALITVFMPEFMLDQHWDGLFGGATEITFYRVSGFILSGSVQAGVGAYKMIHRLKIKREHIRNRQWVSSTITYFDDNWKMEEATQVVIGFDYDFPGRMQTVRGTVSVGVKNGEPDIDTKVEVPFLIRNAERGKLKFLTRKDRCTVMAQSQSDMGYGTRNNWMVQREAGLNWYWRWEVR